MLFYKRVKNLSTPTTGENISYSVRAALLVLALLFSEPVHYLFVIFTIFYYDVLSLGFRVLRKRFGVSDSHLSWLMFAEGLTYIYYDYFSWKVFTTFAPVPVGLSGWLLWAIQKISVLLMTPVMFHYVLNFITTKKQVAFGANKTSSSSSGEKSKSKKGDDNVFWASFKMFFIPPPHVPKKKSKKY